MGELRGLHLNANKAVQKPKANPMRPHLGALDDCQQQLGLGSSPSKGGGWAYSSSGVPYPVKPKNLLKLPSQALQVTH